jgi:hypothetical protein
MQIPHAVVVDDAAVATVAAARAVFRCSVSTSTCFFNAAHSVKYGYSLVDKVTNDDVPPRE